MLVRDFPQPEQPVNRIYEVGEEHVSMTELLAAIFQTGDAITHAQTILKEFGLQRLAMATVEELTQIKGIGRAQAVRLKASLELGKRLFEPNKEQTLSISSPKTAVEILRPLIAYKAQEHFAILYLNTRNRVITHEILYKGTLNTSVVRVCEVFRRAVTLNAAGILIAHNHPSGDVSPSPEDIALTKRLIQAGKLLEIQVLDHIIIGAYDSLSMRERGYAFE